MILTDYDKNILLALNKIRNGQEIGLEDVSSWAVMKKLDEEGKDRENQKTLRSLKKMKKIGIIKLTVLETKNKIKKYWDLDTNLVGIKKFSFPNGRKDAIFIKLKKYEVYEL